MDRQIRQLNSSLINALGRKQRAELALKLADRDVAEAREQLNNALGKRDSSPRLNDTEMAYCRAGQTIDAIKALRARFGVEPNTGSHTLGLKDAKDVVDAWCEANMSKPAVYSPPHNINRF